MTARNWGGLRAALVVAGAAALLAGCSVSGKPPPRPTIPGTSLIEVTIPLPELDPETVENELDAIEAQFREAGISDLQSESYLRQLPEADATSIQLTVDDQDVDRAVAALNSLSGPLPLEVTAIWRADGQEQLRTVANVEVLAAIALYTLAPLLVAILVFSRAFEGEPERRKWWILGIALIPFWWLAVLLRFVPQTGRGTATFAAAIVAVGVELWGLWLLGGGHVFVLVNQSANGSQPRWTPAFPFPTVAANLMQPAAIAALGLGLVLLAATTFVAFRLRQFGNP